jgi:hypothetical protein
LQVGVGGGEVRVPQLPSDQRQRDALVQQLDSVRVAERVRCYAPTDTRRRSAMQLQTRGAGRSGCPEVGPAITQNNGLIGSVARSDNQDPSAAQPQGPSRPGGGDRFCDG